MTEILNNDEQKPIEFLSDEDARLTAALAVLGVSDGTPLHMRLLLISNIHGIALYNEDAELTASCEKSLALVNDEQRRMILTKQPIVKGKD